MELKKKLRKIKIKIKHKLNRIGLYRKDFTIISNNCWGGMIYDHFGLKYNTPTVGLGILGDDYIRFCSDIPKYLSHDIQFIEFETSRYYKLRKDIKPYPVGILDDIEIHFRHYNSDSDAREKWNRRIKRINWDCIILKFSERNSNSKDDVLKFLELDFENKICFSHTIKQNCIYVPKLKDLIGDEYTILAKEFNIKKYLNRIKN